MRQYTVQVGDSPASIAARDDMAGCPKCAVDLIAANPHKAAVVHPNGYRTFESLRAGETINLPDKWFDGSLDTLPKSYFASLSHPDGVTFGVGNFSTLDAATAAVLGLSQLGDRAFAEAASGASDLIDAAIKEAAKTSSGMDAHASAEWARRRALEMAAAVEAGDLSAASAARPEIQNVLSTALTSAREALQSFSPPAPSPILNSLQSVAQAAVSAIASDPNYCASVARAGTEVNSMVHAFKTAWNASGRAPVPINTGNYEEPTAAALASLLGSAPVACALRVPAPPPGPPSKQTVVAPRKEELSTGAVAGIALAGAGAVSGVVYLATRKPKRRRRRR